MALFYFNSQPLVWNGSQIEFGSEGIPVTVGFYSAEIDTPNLFLCQNRNYLVRVGIPDDLTQFGEEIYIGPNLELVPKDLGITFRILQDGAILLNKPFEAELGSTPGIFSLNTSNDWDSVDYPYGLPTLINSCQLCGCSDGYICGTNGVCRGKPGACPDKVPCGFGNGRCPGACPANGYTCKNVNGYYNCVTNQTSGANLWIGISMSLLLLIAIILIAIFAFRPSPKV